MEKEEQKRKFRDELKVVDFFTQEDSDFNRKMVERARKNNCAIDYLKYDRRTRHKGELNISCIDKNSGKEPGE